MKRTILKLTNPQAQFMGDLLDAGFLHRIVPPEMLLPAQRVFFDQMTARHIFYSSMERPTAFRLGENALSAYQVWGSSRTIKTSCEVDDRITMALAHYYHEQDIRSLKEIYGELYEGETDGWREQSDFLADDGAACRRLLVRGLLEYRDDNGLALYRASKAAVAEPRLWIPRVPARLPPAQQRVIDALKTSPKAHVSLQYGRPDLIAYLPGAAVEPERVVMRLRYDLFNRIRPMLTCEVNDPWDDNSALIYRLPTEASHD